MKFFSQQCRSDILNQVKSEGAPVLHLPPYKHLPSNIPSTWREALKDSRPRDYVIENLWEPQITKFPRTIAAMKRSLKGVCLLSTRLVSARLLYLFDYDDYTFIFCGNTPLGSIEKEASILPEYFIEFYGIHNGWTLFYSLDTGPLPVNYWRSLSDCEDREIVEKAQRYINVKNILVVSNLAEDGYMGFDMTSSIGSSYVFWKNYPIEVVPDVWLRLDEEIGEFLEQMNPA